MTILLEFLGIVAAQAAWSVFMMFVGAGLYAYLNKNLGRGG